MASEKRTSKRTKKSISRPCDPSMFPERLYATDRYPPKGRINSYSKPEYLLDIVEALEGTEDLEVIREMCFGPLFDLPVRKCSLSGKLVHQLLCRCVHTATKYEIWFVFAGQAFRFSLREFGILTGLPCGSYPPRDIIKQWQTPPDPEQPYWNILIGEDIQVISIKDIVLWLKRDKRATPEDRMPSWRRIRLALIVIVEGILLCNSQPVRASKEIVEMVKDLEQFQQYPWGRESFLLTISQVKVGNKIESLEELLSKFDQVSTATHGFPIALQLMILKSIPQFEEILPNADDVATFTDRSIFELVACKTFHNSNIMALEKSVGVSL